MADVTLTLMKHQVTFGSMFSGYIKHFIEFVPETTRNDANYTRKHIKELILINERQHGLVNIILKKS